MSPATTWWAMCGLLIAVGLVTVYIGTTPHTARPTTDRPLSDRVRAGVPELTRTQTVSVAAAALVGLVVAITTGWIVALFALPVAALLLPAVLLQPGSNHSIERLVALENWVRALSGVLHAQSGLTGALIATLRSTPEPIYDEVELLVTRLQAQRPAPEALRAFAEDLNDPTGDLIASALILGSKQSGAGLIRTLKPLAASVTKEVAVRRAVESDRSGPRTTARAMTALTAVALGVFLTTTSYGQAYATPFGQGVLAVILAAYFGCLWWMHRMTKDKPASRFLIDPDAASTNYPAQTSGVRS